MDNRNVNDDDDCNRDDIQVMSTSCHQYHIDANKTIDADKSYSSISLSYSIDKSMRGDSSAVKVKDTSILDTLKKSIIFEEENMMMDSILDERDDELLQGRGDSIQCSREREETTGVETLQRTITSLETDLANKSSEVDRLQKELETAAFLSSITEEEAMRKEIGIVILNKMKWMKHDVEQLQSENSNLYKLNKAKSAEIDELKKEKKKAYDSIILLSTQLQLLNDAKIERDLLKEENTSMLEHHQDQIDRLHLRGSTAMSL